jgi:hypothetical protein
MVGDTVTIDIMVAYSSGGTLCPEQTAAVQPYAMSEYETRIHTARMLHNEALQYVAVRSGFRTDPAMMAGSCA